MIKRAFQILLIANHIYLVFILSVLYSVTEVNSKLFWAVLLSSISLLTIFALQYLISGNINPYSVFKRKEDDN